MTYDHVHSAAKAAWADAEDRLTLQNHPRTARGDIRKLRLIAAKHGLFIMTGGRNARLIKVQDPQALIDRMEAGLFGPTSKTCHAIVHGLAQTWPRVTSMGYPARITLKQLAVFKSAADTKNILNSEEPTQ